MVRYNYNKEFFFNETRELAYFLGYFMSDGCMIYNTSKWIYRITFSLSVTDLKIIETFRDWICPELKIHFTQTLRDSGYLSKMCSICICNKEIVKYIKEKYKINTNKTWNPVVPHGINPDFLPDFIRGVFDGDGCVTRKDNNGRVKASIASASKEYLEKIRDILGFGKVNKHSKKSKIYILDFTNYGDIYKFKNYIYYENCICLTRKRNKFINSNLDIKQTVFQSYENDFIRKNLDKLTTQEISDKLGRSYMSVHDRGKQQIDIKIRTNDDIAQLRLCQAGINTQGLSLLSDYFNLHPKTIKNKNKLLGRRISKTTSSYTKEEIEYIRDNFNPYNSGESAREIGIKLNKPIDGIYNKALRLGLVKSKRKLSKEEIQFIRENMNMSSEKIRKKLGLGLGVSTIKRWKIRIRDLSYDH